MAVSYPKELSKCSNEEIYLALLEHVKKLAAQKAGKDTAEKEKKKLYYISAEFLIGKLLSNNLINLRVFMRKSDRNSRGRRKIPVQRSRN